ncbi:MAG: acyl-[ACP]--phospholipid O-acyltransferase [Acidisphaera sp.]|nr:acyl-[ACP]--phospholipid O-acyltransferase [Acidisphaera sp.]
MRPALLRSRRFLPLFLAQALGALNDNLFKNALVVLVLYGSAGGGAMLVPLAGGLFILPFALFSSLAGQLADRHDKSRLIRITKGCEIALMVVAALGLATGSEALLLAVLFGLGTQATFFGPLKYGILPEHLRHDEIVRGNALIEAGTFGAILLGTIAGGALVLLAHGSLVVAGAALLVAAAGMAAALRVPVAAPAAPDLRIGWNIARDTLALLRQARAERTVWVCILGLSWFWTLGATFLAEFPVIARQHFAAEGQVVTAMLTVFSVGVGVGSIAAGRLLRGEVSARHVPAAALLIAVFAFDFGHVCAGVTTASGWHTIGALAAAPRAWRMLADLFLVAAGGGAFSVPLYALVQGRSDPRHRARMIAANNVMNAACMAAGAAALAGLAGLGLSAPRVLQAAALLDLAVALWICRLLPRDALRAVARRYFRLFHRVQVQGLEHCGAAGPGPVPASVIVGNHVSFADGALIAAFLPGDPVFAVHSYLGGKWWARPFLAPMDVFPVDPANARSLRAMVAVVRQGRPLVIFPEGRISDTGALMKIYEGAGMIADKAGVKVLPVRIDGLQHTPLARMPGHRRLFPPLRLTVLPPVTLTVAEGLVGRRRRRAVADALQAVMIDAAWRTRDTGQTLFAALLEASRRFGARTAIVEDTARTPLAYRRLILGALVLGRRLDALAAPGEPVGVLLPNAAGTLVTFYGLQAFGRVPAMLNVSAGGEAMLAACGTAGVRTVLCSRRFAERARLDAALALMARHLRVVFLEDLRGGIGRRAKLRGLLDARRPGRLPGGRADPDAAAVVLFTSGSEGAPKGVVLSHRNILANCAQIAAVTDFSPADRVLNAMPMFHAFGLTGGTILPLMLGVRVFLYPSPLHYRIVPEVAYDVDATVLFGTDTFLAGWGRFAHPYDFRRVRYVFAGAERLREPTRQHFMDRFGVRILEGYGATETAPALALSTAMANRPGSVGRLLPGIEWRLAPVEGLDEGGRLLVRGPNVMRGYLRAERPGVLQPPDGGWYDTGDIVAIDADGFVAIKGRARRFAKIGGEMVSLAAAEDLALAVWPDAAHAVVAVPDPRKGERLVLLTTRADADLRPLLARARARQIPEIMVPRVVTPVAALPLLGTGKIDYPAVERMVEASPARAA